MKKAYKQEWVRNRVFRETAKELADDGLLTEDQLSRIDAAFPENYYHPGIFIRIGLFLFALVASGFTFGFFMLFVVDNGGDTGISIICLISAIIFTIMLHRLIDVKSLFYAGVDSALLYAALLCLAAALFITFDHISLEIASTVILALGLIATYFYADRLIALISFASFLTLLFNLLGKISFGTAILPFVVAGCCIAFLQLIKHNKDLYYESCVTFTRATLLLTLYASCNYLVVREGNAMLNNIHGESPEIPAAILFWIITFLVPAIYLVLGVRKKSRMLIRIGLLTILVSFYTFYHVYPFLPGPEASLAAGICLILTSGALINYLRTPRYRLSDVSDKKNKLAMIELVLAAQQTTIQQSDSSVQFGGGNFGGGGAGNTY